MKCINNDTENSINLRAGSGRNKYANGVVFENGYYSIRFVIYTSKEIIDAEFYIEEEDVGSLQLVQREEERYEFKVIYKGANEKDRSYPFLMMIDSVRLRVHLMFEDESEEHYYSDRVLVTTKSVEDQKNVDDMINYIAGKTGLSRQIDTSYEEDTITLGLFNNHIFNIINLYEKYRGFYEGRFLGIERFAYKRRRMLLSNFMGSSSMRNKKVEKERLLIMGFLSETLYSSQKLYRAIEEIIRDMEIRYERLQKSIPKGYSAPIVTTYRLRIDRVHQELKRLSNHIIKLRNILLRNKYRSDEKISLDTKVEDFINPIFGMYMYRWNRAKKVNLRYHEFFFKIDSLDKLYEYYCLARILNCLKKIGYKFSDRRDKQFFYPTDNNIFQNESTLFNTFYREKDGINLTIYFQPLIYRDKILNDLDLIRTSGGDSNFTNFNKTGSYYSPDFILKFEGKETRYLILDAKYQSRNTILRGHMDQVISKYFSQIRNKCGKRNQMVYILQGRVDENLEDTWFYENPGLDSIDFFSDFGIFQFSPDKIRNFSLIRLIEKLGEEAK